MTLFRLQSLALAMLLAAIASYPTVSHAVEATADEDAAAQLVIRALECGIAGKNEARRALLQQAIKTAPDYAPAHWQLGHVKVGGKWQFAADAAAVAGTDPRYAEYRELRKTQADTIAGQLLLARWCKQHGLEQEEQMHWVGVLSHNPSNREAIKALGLHKYRNHWLTLDQIEQVKLAEREFEKARDYWKPRLERWAEAIDRRETGRQAALDQLRAIDDPAVIVWLEAYLSPRSAQLGLEVVEVVSCMQRQEGTESLVRHALASDFPEVRAAASEKLKEVPLDTFVGTLVESLTSPPEVKSESLQGRSVFHDAQEFEQFQRTGGELAKGGKNLLNSCQA